MPTDTAIGTPRMGVPCVATGQRLEEDTLGVALLQPRRKRVDVYEHGAGVLLQPIEVDNDTWDGPRIGSYIDHPTDSLWVHVDSVQSLIETLRKEPDKLLADSDGACYVCEKGGTSMALQVNRSDAPVLQFHAGACTRTIVERLVAAKEVLPKLLGHVL